MAAARAEAPPEDAILRIEAGLHTAPIAAVATDSQNRWAVSASWDKTARVWDIATGKLLRVLRVPMEEGDDGKLFAAAMSPDGQTVAVGGWTLSESGNDYVVYVFNPHTGALVQRLTGYPSPIRHLRFNAEGKTLAVGLSDVGDKPRPTTWQPPDTHPTADLRGSTGTAFVVDASGYQFQFGFQANGKIPYHFDLRQRQLTAGTLANGTPARTDKLTPNQQAAALPLEPDDVAHSIALAPTPAHAAPDYVPDFVLGSDRTLRLSSGVGQERWWQLTPAPAWGVHIPASGKVVLAAYGDGTIRWHRLSDGEELLAFFPHADRKRWVLWTPSGYYDASPNGGDALIGWHINRAPNQLPDFYAIHHYKNDFFRPDVIDRILETLEEESAVAASARQRKQ